MNQSINTLEAMKVARSRVYTQYSLPRANDKGNTRGVSQEQFKQLKSEKPPLPSTAGDSVKSTWLYVTKSESAFQKKGEVCVLISVDPFSTSPDVPDWFKIKEKPTVLNADVTKAPGYDGTMTLLSRINGWITVTPKEKNRSQRLGRYGPFDRSKKGYDLRNVSDLAPAWMQTQSKKPEGPAQFKKMPGSTAMREVTSRQGQKRTYLIDIKQPQKSQFSIGDFRHNVMTKAEADAYMSKAEPIVKNMFAWPEEQGKQRYDKPVTGKIGAPNAL